MVQFFEELICNNLFKTIANRDVGFWVGAYVQAELLKRKLCQRCFDSTRMKVRGKPYSELANECSSYDSLIVKWDGQQGKHYPVPNINELKTNGELLSSIYGWFGESDTENRFLIEHIISTWKRWLQ